MAVKFPTRASIGQAAEAREQIRAQERLPTASATTLVLGTASNGLVWTTPTATLGATATQFQTQYAVQADMESATSTSLSVNPAVQHFHPLMPKAWALWSTTSATGLITGVNVSSVERTGNGTYTLSFTTPFTSTNYGFMTGVTQDVGTQLAFMGLNATGANGQLASVFDIITISGAGAAADPNGLMSALFFGDY